MNKLTEPQTICSAAYDQ